MDPVDQGNSEQSPERKFPTKKLKLSQPSERSLSYLPISLLLFLIYSLLLTLLPLIRYW